LQQYLKTLQKTKKIHLKGFNLQSNVSQPRPMKDYGSELSQFRRKNSNYSFDDPSPLKSPQKKFQTINLSSNLVDQDDIYLIHPEKILESKAGMSPRKNRRYESVKNISPLKEISLKPQNRNKIVNAIEQLAEDRETFMKFYYLKEPLLPKEITVH